jgi:hypothetical protein
MMELLSLMWKWIDDVLRVAQIMMKARGEVLPRGCKRVRMLALNKMINN